MQHRDGARGYTLVEGLVALVVAGLVIVLLWGLFLHLVRGQSPMSVVTGTSRTLVQQQTRVGLRLLFHRLQEAVQILEPLPGKTDDQLLFRDLLNRTIRLRFDRDRRELVSERAGQGDFVREAEVAPDDVVARPIVLSDIDNVVFTVLSPTAAFIALRPSDRGVEDTSMTIIHLGNGKLGL